MKATWREREGNWTAASLGTDHTGVRVLTVGVRMGDAWVNAIYNTDSWSAGPRRWTVMLARHPEPRTASAVPRPPWAR